MTDATLPAAPPPEAILEAALYAEDLKSKCGETPDMDLLTKVTIGLGPSIYNQDAATVAGSDPSELETVKANFLMKKLFTASGAIQVENQARI